MEPPDPSGGGEIHASTPPGAARDLPLGHPQQDETALPARNQCRETEHDDANQKSQQKEAPQAQGLVVCTPREGATTRARARQAQGKTAQASQQSARKWTHAVSKDLEAGLEERMRSTFQKYEAQLEHLAQAFYDQQAVVTVQHTQLEQAWVEIQALQEEIRQFQGPNEASQAQNPEEEQPRAQSPSPGGEGPQTQSPREEEPQTQRPQNEAHRAKGPGGKEAQREPPQAREPRQQQTQGPKQVQAQEAHITPTPKQPTYATVAAPPQLQKSQGWTTVTPKQAPKSPKAAAIPELKPAKKTDKDARRIIFRRTGDPKAPRAQREDLILTLNRALARASLPDFIRIVDAGYTSNGAISALLERGALGAMIVPQHQNTLLAAACRADPTVTMVELPEQWYRIKVHGVATRRYLSLGLGLAREEIELGSPVRLKRDPIWLSAPTKVERDGRTTAPIVAAVVSQEEARGLIKHGLRFGGTRHRATQALGTVRGAPQAALYAGGPMKAKATPASNCGGAHQALDKSCPKLREARRQWKQKKDQALKDREARAYIPDHLPLAVVIDTPRPTPRPAPKPAPRGQGESEEEHSHQEPEQPMEGPEESMEDAHPGPSEDTHPPTQSALELGLELGVGLVCLQEPYNRGFSHRGYLIYWPEGDLQSCRVAVAVRRDLGATLVVNARMDLTNHPYALVVDIMEGPRRTRVINCYDNWVGAEACWQGSSPQRRRAIEDIDWRHIFHGRCLLVGDFNAHSPIWNPQRGARLNAGPLEQLIEDHDLLVNNDPDIPTRPKTSPGLSIIDLSLTTLELGPLEAWETYPGRPTGSDHEVIGMRWAPLAPKPPRTPREGVTGWRIKELQEDEEAMKAAAETWRALSQAQAPLGDTCTREDIAQEAEWISEALTEVLNQHAKPIWVTPFSKRWWTDPVREARRQYAGARRLWQQGCIEDEHHRTARQTYYKAIRQAKRECWEAFLQGSQEPGHHPPGTPPTPDEAARCWLALKYTKPQDQGTTPTLYRAQGNTQAATTFQEKETLIREAAFPQAPRDRPVQCPPLGNAHTEATESAVKQALFSQATQKAPGVDQLNFQALRLLWKWDSQRIVTLARQCLRLGFHPPSWKVAKGILLRKPNKTNYSLVKAYRVISLLNCLGKVVEKMVATQIAEFCEQKQTLHNGQMGARRHRSAPDAVGCLIEEVHQSWAAKQLAATLFMDIKGAFDHVNAALLVNRLEAMGLDGSLVNWGADG
ncbi:hypothetical protein SI65_09658 [Aspergillus cristatus]|uniref:Reverse transcriptase domain-containing protein n=1 Tax=Aspergillus cristatus TaxID=573508 RepID=A0A1E3B388_ASPCR|nr:hypothetical protein SI65_09658 [Aspergillus cristatus]